MKKLILPAALALCCVPLAARAISSTQLHYDFADQYTPCGAALNATVRHLDIHWLSGDVHVQYHDEPTVAFFETANRTLDENTTMRHWLDGDTLHIQFGAEGLAKLRNLQKELTLYLPQDAALESLTVETASAGVHIQDIRSDSASVSTVSGLIDAQRTEFTRHAAFSTTSGAITLLLKGSADQLEFGSVYGRIDVFADRAEWLRARTTSGRITLSAACAEHTEINSVSGAVSLTQREAAGSAAVNTVSGKVTLRMPADAGFTLQTATLSGRVRCDFPCQTANSRTIVGSGANLLKISTLSGGIHLVPAE